MAIHLGSNGCHRGENTVKKGTLHISFTSQKSTVFHVSFTIMYNYLAMQSLIGEWVCVKTLLKHKGLITIVSRAVRCPQFTSLSLCYKCWGCSIWLLSAVLLLSFLLAPAEIKGFLHRAHVHVGMPWHMFESEHNMCGFTFECVCVRHEVIWVFNCLFVCALLWGFVDAWQHMFLLWVCVCVYVFIGLSVCASVRLCVCKFTCI